MHSYVVSLRIAGEELDLQKLTSDLGVEPTQIRIKGQPRSDGKSKWDENMWEYETLPTGMKHWDSLEEALKEIVEKFVCQKRVLREYQQRFKVELFCGHFSSSFNGGPRLSPAILQELGDFGVELYLDTYSSSE